VFPLIPDIRFAVRKFRRAPGLSMAAVVTLVLGVGVNTAVFSMVDGVWLRPLPIADPAHLVEIESVKNQATRAEQESGSSYAEFSDLREQVPALADAVAVDRRGVALETDSGLELLLADVVSDNYFRSMGVQPEVGRLPDENETRRGGNPVVVLGHTAWKRFFSGDPAVVGRSVRIKGGLATIVAVLPAGFRGTERFIDPQVYVPQSSWFTWNPEDRTAARTYRNNYIYARLRPGATLTQARAQLQSVSADLQAKYPEANAGRSFTADWQAKSTDTQMKMLSMLLLAIAAAVLLIACTNIANLLLALNDSRRREIAMRTALGAKRGQLVRQLVTEYAVLAVVGTAGALFLAQNLIAVIPKLIPDIGIPLGFDFRIDLRALAFTAVAGTVSVLICGVIPALAAIRTSPLDAMRAQASPGGRLKLPARRMFIIGQIAVSMALLMATGLLVKALLQVETMNMGFNNKQNAVLLGVALDQDGPRRGAEVDALVNSIKGLPGVRDASVARVVPFPESGGGATRVVLAPGEIPSDTVGTPVWFNSVGAGYFRAMGVPLMRGRAFGSEDTATSERTAIVNLTLAKKLFGTEDVVGRHLRMGRKQPVDAEIVGLTRDGKYSDVSEAPQPYLYLPLTQESSSEVVLIATTNGNPGPLLPPARKAVQQVSSGIVILTSQTLTDHMRLATLPNRMSAWLTASLGGLALLLTAVGLYGVTAYTVSRRTHEIGIRMALGALRGAVFLSILGDGLKLALLGTVLGTGLALLLGRGIASLLFGVKPWDPVTLLVIFSLVMASSVAALTAPARRALLVDPVEALREE
jgi:putative ABC transport system permease protein